jgi:hypothetical protein
MGRDGFRSVGVYDTAFVNNNSATSDWFMGITAYNVVTSVHTLSEIPSLTAFFGLSSMIVVCVVIIVRGLRDEKQTLSLNIARNVGVLVLHYATAAHNPQVREQSVSMRTIFAKQLVPDYSKLKSDAKFKQLLLQVHTSHSCDRNFELFIPLLTAYVGTASRAATGGASCFLPGTRLEMLRLSLLIRLMQDDLVQVTKERDQVIEKLRESGHLDNSDVMTEISTSSAEGRSSNTQEKAGVLSKAEKLSQKLFELNQEIVSRQKIRRSCTGGAFITFRSTQAAITFLRCHVKNHNLSSSFSESDAKHETIAMYMNCCC